jgi:hypothetical protein
MAHGICYGQRDRINTGVIYVFKASRCISDGLKGCKTALNVSQITEKILLSIGQGGEIDLPGMANDANPYAFNK